MRLLFALAVLLGVLVAGCSDGDGDGTTTGTSTTTGTTTGTATGTTTGTTGPPMGTGEVIEVTISAVGIWPVTPTLEPAQVSAPAGATLRVTYRNEDVNPLIAHDLRFEAGGAQSAQIAPGEEVVLEFVIPVGPGDYPYYCAIGNHREMGMEGTLTVT